MKINKYFLFVCILSFLLIPNVTCLIVYGATDIVTYLTQYTWTNLDAEQGVCTDGTYIYVTSTYNLSKWSEDGTRLYSIDAFHGDTDVDHAGDCCYYDDKIYVICTNYPTSTIRRPYVYSASDLSFVTNYTDTTDIPSGDEVSGICFDGDYFWLCTGKTTSDKAYKYSTSFVYQNENHILGFTLCQGLDYHDGSFYVVGDYNLREFNSGWTLMNIQYDIEAHEGIGITPNGQYMFMGKWHSASDDPLLKYTIVGYDDAVTDVSTLLNEIMPTIITLAVMAMMLSMLDKMGERL